MELVKFSAADGAQLHGVYSPAPETEIVRQATCDAAIFLHGAGSNFYGSSLLPNLLPALNRLGLSTFAINTRGHDLVSTLRTAADGRMAGAAFEIVDECRHDVRGAVDWLFDRGHQNIALIGHSLGALKAIYSQANDSHEAVSHIVAISPPLLSYAAFAGGPRRREFLSMMSRAEQLVAAGEGAHLLNVTIPLPLLISAAGYVDKYGPAERYNLLKFAADVPQPIQFTFGGREVTSGSEAFGGFDDQLRKLGHEHGRNWDIRVIADAGHFYTGHYEALAEEIEHWPPWRG